MTAANEDSTDEIAGLPLEEAVDAVVRDHSIDEDRARTVLQPVAEDGTVTWEGAQDRLGHVSKVVSTPESRLEFAEMDMSAAREAAGPVSDLDVVASRFEPFEQRIDGIEARVEDLRETLQQLVTQLEDRNNLFSLAREMATLSDAANRTQVAADELAGEIQDLETWLTDPETRYDQLEEDIDALEASMARFGDSIDEIAAAIDDPEATIGAETRDGTPEGAAVGHYWFDARLQQAVFDLLIEDARVEYEAFTEWAARTEEQTDRLGALGDRLDDLETRCVEQGDRLEDLADEEFHDDFDPRIEGFEMTLAAYEPPVDWNAVESALEDHRPDLTAD